MRQFLAYIREGSVPEDPDSFVSRLDQSVLEARRHKEWRLEYMTLQMRYDQIREEAHAEGRVEGHAEGLKEGIIRTLLSFVKQNRLSVQEASEQAGMSEQEFLEVTQAMESIPFKRLPE